MIRSTLHPSSYAYASRAGGGLCLDLSCKPARNLPIFRWAELSLIAHAHPLIRALLPSLAARLRQASSCPVAAPWRLLEASSAAQGVEEARSGPLLASPALAPSLALLSIWAPHAAPVCPSTVDQEGGGGGGWSDGLATMGQGPDQDEGTRRGCREESGSAGQSAPGKPSGMPGG